MLYIKAINRQKLSSAIAGVPTAQMIIIIIDHFYIALFSALSDCLERSKDPEESSAHAAYWGSSFAL